MTAKNAMSRTFGRVDIGNDHQQGLLHRGMLSTVSVVVQGLLRFLYSVVIGRALGPALLATTNSAISLAQFASLLWPAASGSAATKFVARARGAGDLEQAKASARFLARRTMLVSVALAVPVGAYEYLFGSDHDWVAALLVAALTIALSTYNFVRGVYFAVGLVSRAVAWDALCAVGGLVALGVVVLLHWTAVLLAPLVLCYAVYAIAGWPRPHRGSVPVQLRQEMNAFVLWSTIASLASGGFLQLSMVIAHAQGTPTEAGMYAAALSLATPASMIGSVLTILLFPSMAHAVGRKDRASLRQQTDAATRGLVVVLGAAFGTLVLVSHPLVQVVYGTRFASAAPILIVLLAATLTVTLGVASVNALQAGSRETVRVPAIMSAVGMGIGLVMMFLLSTSMSTTGVAVGYLCGAAVIGLGPAAVVWVKHRMPWGTLALRMVAGALVVAGLLWCGEQFGASLIVTILTAVAFLIVWCAMMFSEVRPLLAAALGRARNHPSSSR